MKRFYIAWGSALLLVFGGFHYFGWTLSSTDEVKNVPKSVRDNPGAYRTHYTGGK